MIQKILLIMILLDFRRCTEKWEDGRCGKNQGLCRVWVIPGNLDLCGGRLISRAKNKIHDG